MKNDRSLSLFIVLIVASVMLLMMALQDQGPVHGRSESASIDPKSKIVESKVNQHLAATSRTMEIQEERLRVENSAAPQVGDRLWPEGKPSESEGGLDFSQDRHERSVYEDLDRHPQRYPRMGSPQTVIQNEQVEKEANFEYQQKQREEYVQQFLDNARRNGYLVKLSEDLVVISVQKIQNTSTSLSDQPFMNGSR